MRRSSVFAIACALAFAGVWAYTPVRHDGSYTTNGVTYAQRGGLGSADYVVTNIDANAVGRVKSVNGKDGVVTLDYSDVSALPDDQTLLEGNANFSNAVVSVSPPVELPDKWALANVTNATGGAVSAVDVGAPTRAEVEAGWWSEWVVRDHGSIITNAEIIYFPATGYWQASVDGDYVDGMNGSADATYLEFSESGKYLLTATRHRVAAPVPTKPSDIGAASLAAHTSLVAQVSIVSNVAMNAAQVSDVINGFTPWVFSDGVQRTFVKFALSADDTWLSPYRYGYRIDAQPDGAYYAFSVEPEVAFLKFAFFEGTPVNPDEWGTDYDFSASRTDLNIARRTETEAALAGKASTNDVQLTPAYGEWTITRDGVDVTAQVPQPVFSQEQGEWWVGSSHISSDMTADGTKGGTENSTHLAWEAFADAFGDHIASYSAVRVAVGYVLGAQADKVLASTNLQTGVSAATVTNVVDEVKELHYDEVLNVTWETRIVGGEMKFFAVTNANISVLGN